MTMNTTRIFLLMVLALASVAGCKRDDDRAQVVATSGIRQTAFPGQVTAGGGTSGAVLARTARPETDGTYAGGSPGTAGGSGGNTGGAAMGGTVQESGKGPTEGVAPVTGAPGAAAPAGTTPAPDGVTPPGSTTQRGSAGETSGDMPTAGKTEKEGR